MTKKYLFPSAALTLLLLSEIPAFAYGGGRGSPADGAMHGTVVQRKVMRKVMKRDAGKMTRKRQSSPSQSMMMQEQPASVSIAGFSFSPATLRVKKGATVTWTNTDSAPHTVTGDQGGETSGTLAQGQSYSFTFDALGTFPYHCRFHSGMRGTVEVTP